MSEVQIYLHVQMLLTSEFYIDHQNKLLLRGPLKVFHVLNRFILIFNHNVDNVWRFSLINLEDFNFLNCCGHIVFKQYQLFLSHVKYYLNSIVIQNNSNLEKMNFKFKRLFIREGGYWNLICVISQALTIWKKQCFKSWEEKINEIMI